MRFTILTSVFALAVAFTGTAFADYPGEDNGQVIQRPQQPLPQPELPDDQYGDYQGDEYQNDQDYQVNQPQVQNNIVIENPGFQGHSRGYELPFRCVTCFIDWGPDFTTVVAVGQNGRAQIVFADYPGPNSIYLIDQVESMKFRGICLNLILRPQPPCNGGCGGNGGGVILPAPIYAQPHDGYYPPPRGWYPPRRGGGYYPPRRGNGPRPFPRPHRR